MLFNSFPFLFIYLPIVLLGYQIAGHLHRRGVVLWLGISSLAFYAYWHPPFLLVLITSISLNYFFSCLISRRIHNGVDTRAWLWLAITGNLGALCYFKYLFPLLGFLASVAHSGHDWGRVLLPLGISFFTFTQIAYLVDLQQGVASVQDFPSYLLFVSFFPHLIAGPILHHKDIMPQFQQQRDYRLSLDDLAVGFSWFIMGLFKKVMLADTFGLFADPVFAMPGKAPVGYAWLGVLSYAMQLYFDFSGYSDMALGLARMFSIQFPLNFSSPYKAVNIIDFWNRWHMTLTQYITSYVFTPVQKEIIEWRQKRGQKVSRKALATPSGFIQLIALPTLFTMGLVGVWHGAGIQYILFGLLHGLYIVTTHGWRILRTNWDPIPDWIGARVRHVFSVGLTFLAVVVGQVFFRSTNTHSALVLLRQMVSFHATATTGGMGAHGITRGWALIPVGFFIVWFMPNTQQMLSNFRPALALSSWDLKPALIRLFWQPSGAWSIILSIALMTSLVHFQDPSTFLYFQF